MFKWWVRPCKRNSQIKVGSDLLSRTNAYPLQFFQLCNLWDKQWLQVRFQQQRELVKIEVQAASLLQQNNLTSRWSTSSLWSNCLATNGPQRKEWNCTKEVLASMTWTLSASSTIPRMTGLVFTHIPNLWASTIGKMILFTQTSSEPWKSRKSFNRATANYK